MRRLGLLATMFCVSLLLTGQAGAQQWVASWTASAHGPYPIGNPSAQPDLRLVFPDRAARDGLTSRAGSVTMAPAVTTEPRFTSTAVLSSTTLLFCAAPIMHRRRPPRRLSGAA